MAGIYESFVTQYQRDIDILLRQEGSLLRQVADIETVTGERAFFEQMGNAPARLYTSRHQDSPMMEVPYERRAVFINTYDWGAQIDKADKIKMIIDPTSEYQRGCRAALSLVIDDLIINAAFGTAMSGKNGDIPVTLPSTQTIPVNDHTFDSGSGNVPMTIGKMQSANTLFEENYVSADEIKWMVISPKQKQRLMQTTQTQDINYNDVKALSRGDLKHFMGFNLITSNRLGSDPATGFDRILCLSPGAIRLGMGEEITVKLGERPDKCFNWYLYAALSLGAVRMQEAKVVQILATP